MRVDDSYLKKNLRLTSDSCQKGLKDSQTLKIMIVILKNECSE